MTDGPILVTGATGTIGGEAVRQLHAGGRPVRALVRDPAKAKALLPDVEIVIGDLLKPDSLAAAFTGVSKVFVTANGPEFITLEQNAYDAAKAAGVGRIVKLSGRHVDAEWLRGYPLAINQEASEAALQRLDIPWTILRPGFFSSNFLGFVDPIRNEVMLPVGDGADTPTDPRDIAAVAILGLTQDGHAGRIYEITGSELLPYREMIAMIAGATGRPLTLANVSDEVAKAGLESIGVPAPQAAGLVRYFKAAREGDLYPPTDTIHELLGRPPIRFAQWVHDTYSSKN